MEIQCECGKFRAKLVKFPKATAGRLKCYCDDCQSFLHYIGRADLLDANGGSEVIPVYPAEIQILKGKEQIKCTRVAPSGMYRFSTACCNTPIANTHWQRAWAGLHRRMFTARDPQQLDRCFPEVRASIMGKYAHGTPPPGTPEKFNFKGFTIVFPFILKGVIGGKRKPSPFFDGETPVGATHLLSKEERMQALAAAGHPKKID